jgi:hypothetical protein
MSLATRRAQAVQNDFAGNGDSEVIGKFFFFSFSSQQSKILIMNRQQFETIDKCQQ